MLDNPGGWSEAGACDELRGPLSIAPPGAFRVLSDLPTAIFARVRANPDDCRSAGAPAVALADGRKPTRRSTAPAPMWAARPRARSSATRRTASRWSSRPTGRSSCSAARGGTDDARALQRQRLDRHDALAAAASRRRQFGGTRLPDAAANSGAVAMTAGRVGQHRRRRLRRRSRWSSRASRPPALTTRARSATPHHLVDYTARALAIRPNGSIVLVGYGRDRHASAAVPPTGPAVLYGLRAIVTLPATGNSTTACGTYSSNGSESLGSAGVTVDGVNADGSGADPRTGRALLRRRRRAPGQPLRRREHERPQRHGLGAAVHRRRCARRHLRGRSRDAARERRARTRAARRRIGARSRRDGRRRRLGQSQHAGRAHRPTAPLAAYGIRRHRTARRVAGGNNTGQAIAVLGDGSVIVGGSGFSLRRGQDRISRSTASRRRACATFQCSARTARPTTPFGDARGSSGYITGMALLGPTCSLSSGRLTDCPPAWSSRPRAHYATGAPPAPAAAARRPSTLGVDGITSTSACCGSGHGQRQRHCRELVAGVRPEHGLRDEVGRAGSRRHDERRRRRRQRHRPGARHALPRASRDLRTASARLRATTSPSRRSARRRRRVSQPRPAGKRSKKFCKVARVVGGRRSTSHARRSIRRGLQD